ncbi:hypothetical protein SprV_0301210100 [Sparganum proliferum]
MVGPSKEDQSGGTALVLTLEQGSSDLIKLLQKLQELSIDVSHLETRLSKERTAAGSAGKLSLDVLVHTESKLESAESLLHELENSCGCKLIPVRSLKEVEVVPWFPQRIDELDIISNHVLMYGAELDADHPGFHDEQYRKRRNAFAEIAYKYKHGDLIPRIEYTTTEKKTWSVIYRELTKLYERYACREFLENLPLLQKEDELPQLEDVSKFLKWRSGFTVRPVAGYISARDFLSGLAFRVFFCTQYIRHPSDPFYTPEPDCVHELMGHMPLLADPSFARFSQELGLASLGASDDEVKRLASVYFFTVEFGLCHQDGELRAYGAGLLSSIGELKHALSDASVKKPFVPEEVIKAECLVTTFQNAYFVTSSFEEAKDKMRHFTQGIRRPFAVNYNPYTECVEVMDNLAKVTEVLNEVKAGMSIVDDALCQFVESRKDLQIKNWRMSDPRPGKHPIKVTSQSCASPANP